MRARLQKAVVELESLLASSQRQKANSAVSLASWSEYIKTRGLEEFIVGGDQSEIDLRSRVLSKLLSYPLTLARNMQKLDINKKQTEIHVLGARAEATLPEIYWNEVVASSFPATDIKLVFIGPQVPSTLDEKTTLHGDSLQLHFRKALYEETALTDPDCFYLCNSGVGNEGEMCLWRKTFERKILSSGRKGIFTSFSNDDLSSDLSALRQNSWGSELELESLNPMRSLWEEFDHNKNSVYSNHSSFVMSFD
mmetsp:Transcript_16409/g.19930  ORF Transcript_16409/g.19930 Transcript_16409/m.19930 type:complete len:252 (-) Transcript_16409:342-1097(-)